MFCGPLLQRNRWLCSEHCVLSSDGLAFFMLKGALGDDMKVGVAFRVFCSQLVRDPLIAALDKSQLYLSVIAPMLRLGGGRDPVGGDLRPCRRMRPGASFGWRDRPLPHNQSSTAPFFSPRATTFVWSGRWAAFQWSLSDVSSRRRRWLVGADTPATLLLAPSKVEH